MSDVGGGLEIMGPWGFRVGGGGVGRQSCGWGLGGVDGLWGEVC